MERPRIDAAARRAGHERLRDDLLEIRSRIADITATADSPDGLISATVVGRGELSELRLDPRIYRTADAKALAATIVDTVREAVARSQEELFAVVRQFLPPGAELATSDVHTDPFLHQLDKEIERG
ncbi:YbaB/EbfC family nucleoid-associated protein [Actinokineospora sp. UTMC 2448]|uniref:YbaB/EbfC family nucleoid-associated protein n=1 Tax=Actinokineospora sp. UTMC 2448 TaxID=2268449 RepID=UPI002164708A|nr:YbaB/EbfC family nucleoid-associated protein [Actinokineospora sp. UTMC 2448]UVS79630.1 DNA-binding protein, YbaB/EbfC family [Actinokineospora sp. UTMC 2448]